MSSGVGVEKSFLMHSPLVEKVEVTKRSKVRRNYLSYMRALTGKATRLSGIDFDMQSVNTVLDKVEESADIEEVVDVESVEETTEPEAKESDKTKE
jgi:large subunit ribosomal protein L19